MPQGTDSTTPALAAQRFVEAFNARDEQALRTLYHPDARIKRPTWPSEGDLAASPASIQLDFGAYPDGQIGVRQVVVQDRVAVVEFQFEGKKHRAAHPVQRPGVTCDWSAASPQRHDRP
jgi:hypothetical protein